MGEGSTSWHSMVAVPIRDRAASKFAEVLCLVEREALCAYRQHNINGTEQCKKISNLLDRKFQSTG